MTFSSDRIRPPLQQKLARRRSRNEPIFCPDDTAWCDVPAMLKTSSGPWHAWRAWGPFDAARMMKNLSAKLLRSEVRVNAGPTGKFNVSSRHAAFQLNRELLALVDSTELWVYARTPEIAAEHGSALAREYFKGDDKPGFYLVRTTASDRTFAERVPLQKGASLTNESMTLHYGEEFVPWHEAFIKQFRSQSSGISIFEGPPGTGKTSYIRYLVSELFESHRFFFIPSANLHLLRSSAFVGFWTGQRETFETLGMVIVLEDAEEALMPRGRDNRAEVTLLLNLTDGVLGDYLRIHVIATINDSVSTVDPALLRPGRLVGHRVFERLPLERAQRLALHLKRELPAGAAEFSLAEIFAGKLDPGTRLARKVCTGFAA